MREKQTVVSEYISFHAPLNAYYFITLLMQWYIQIYFGLNQYSAPPWEMRTVLCISRLIVIREQMDAIKKTRLDFFVDGVIHDTHIHSWSDRWIFPYIHHSFNHGWRDCIWWNSQRGGGVKKERERMPRYGNSHYKWQLVSVRTSWFGVL